MTPDQRTALAGWLGDVLGLQGMPEVSQISGGQSNPTYVVAMDGRKMVLRKQPPGPLLKGAHAVDREYRVQSALRDTGVPVADMLAWCGKANVLGTPFYVMDWIDGRVFHETSLPGAPTEDRRREPTPAPRSIRALGTRPDRRGSPSPEDRRAARRAAAGTIWCAGRESGPCAENHTHTVPY